ncbi:MAG: ABC transporter ATP-binding protein [Planctomycetota bacterium]
MSRVYRMGEVEIHALREADLAVRQGEILVILGPSGSGKSTLLNILGGIDRATSGRVLFHDRNITDFSVKELTLYRRTAVGFVFQFYNLIHNLTARENVELACEIVDRPLDPLETLTRVGLGERAEHFPSQLSGGEQQRVAIARGLAKNPEFLLCDEPTGALDYETGKQVLHLLQEINGASGLTMVLVTHNAAIGAIGDRTARMRSGRIMDITVNERRADPEEIEW